MAAVSLGYFYLSLSPLTPSLFQRRLQYCMGDSAKMRSPTKTSIQVENSSFKDSVTPTWTTSAAKVTRLLSEKLSTWGVEERGVYRILTSGPNRP